MPGSSTGLSISTPQLLNPQATWIPLKLGPSHLPRRGRYTLTHEGDFIQWHKKFVSVFFFFWGGGGGKGVGGFFELLMYVRASHFIHMFFFLRYFFSSGGMMMELLWPVKIYIRQLATQNDSSTSATSWGKRCFLTNVCPNVDLLYIWKVADGQGKNLRHMGYKMVRWCSSKYNVDMQMISTKGPSRLSWQRPATSMTQAANRTSKHFWSQHGSHELQFKPGDTVDGRNPANQLIESLQYPFKKNEPGIYIYYFHLRWLFGISKPSTVWSRKHQGPIHTASLKGFHPG